MKKLTSRFLCLALALTLVLGTAVTASAASPITLEIDGKTVASAVAPVVDNGTTLVPLRVVTETLGADVKWDAAKKQAIIKTAGFNMVFTINSKTYMVNGSEKTLNVAPKLINGSTMVPMRALAESMGALVDYDAKANKAIVKYFSDMSGSIKVSGSTTVLPIMQAATDQLLAMNKGLSIAVAGGGSGTGIKECQAGSNNVGMSSRDLTADELKTLNVVSMANDGIALIVHPKNPVKGLTKDQAKKIFMGEIKNWKDVGGNDAPILVQTRETGSGTLATLEEMLLDKKKVVASATPFASSALLKQAVAKSENSIGFDSIGFVDKTVKALELDGIAPDDAAVKSAKYGLSRSLYVFTKGQATGVNAKLIDYLRTKACQTNIVAKEGYISIY